MRETQREGTKNHSGAYEAKTLIVINPRSGNYRGKILQKRITAAIFSQNHANDAYYITEWRELPKRIDQAVNEGIRSFIVMGGDGTVAAIATCLRGTQSTISIIPTGTSNMLAQVLGIPSSPKNILQMMHAPRKTETIDGIEINNKLFFMNASTGISSTSLEGLKQEQKSSLGLIAYVFAVIQHISKVSPKTFSLEIDNKLYRVRAAEVFIANTSSLLAPQYKLVDSKIDDGKLEVCIVHKSNTGEIINALLDILKRTQKRTIHCIARAEKITIRCKETLPVQADGDIIGKTPITIKVVSAAATFVIP
jgi:diacylglycerol kinase (ATP)